LKEIYEKELTCLKPDEIGDFAREIANKKENAFAVMAKEYMEKTGCRGNELCLVEERLQEGMTFKYVYYFIRKQK